MLAATIVIIIVVTYRAYLNRSLLAEPSALMYRNCDCASIPVLKLTF